MDENVAAETSLAQALERAAERQPDGAALIFRGRRISYWELSQEVSRCASGLSRLGVGAGDRFGLMMRNSPEFVIVSYALARLGAIAVPVNFLLKPGEIEYIFGHAGAVGAITQPRYLPTVREAARRLPRLSSVVCAGDRESGDAIAYEELVAHDADVRPPAARPEDVACILYTSGTTGKPKGAMLTHRNILSNVRSCAQAIDISSDDVFMCLLPMFHTFAWTTCVVLPLTVGCATVALESLQPLRDVASQIRKHSVSIFIAVPPVFAAMTRIPFWQPLRFLLPIRVCVSGAAPLPAHVLEKFERKFGLPLLEGYGLTETSPVVSLNPLYGERRPGTVGLALPDVEVIIRQEDGSEAQQGEIGEICVRGPNVMLGYYDDPAATRKTIDSEG